MPRARATSRLPDPEERRRRILTSAAVKAADLLDVQQRLLARVLGVSPASVSRMRSGAYFLDPQRKEWDLALLFVRLYRSLDSITAGREADARAWLHSENRALGARPADLLSDVTGLVHTVDYLDSIRGRV